MDNKIKNASVSLMVIVIVFTVILAIVFGLLSIWKSGSVPVAYVIVDVINNTQVELPECDSPKLTILKNVATDQISYRCDIQGKISEIVTLYE